MSPAEQAWLLISLALNPAHSSRNFVVDRTFILTWQKYTKTKKTDHEVRRQTTKKQMTQTRQHMQRQAVRQRQTKTD